jgi:alcohol dehydrogenase class IV
MIKEFVGIDCLAELPSILEDHKAQHIFLVTGRNSFYSSGAHDFISASLSDKTIVHFNEFSANPKIEDVAYGVKKMQRTKCDVVLAIGGGSAIDMAKLINIIAHQNADAVEIATGLTEIKCAGLPLIAIPTTAGSGTEATHFAVVYIENSKYSLAHTYIMPEYALVDPSLTFNLPPALTAISGFDALSQSVESYWSIRSTEESRSYASQAIQMIISKFESAVNYPDESARTAMSLAAHLAGKAINISKTTAVHAVSYPLTTFYKIPHGHALALLLGKFFLINADYDSKGLVDTRGKKYFQKTMEELYQMLNCASPEECSHKWYELMNAVGLESDLASLGISKRSDIELITENVNLERLDNHPVKITKRNIAQLFL